MLNSHARTHCHLVLLVWGATVCSVNADEPTRVELSESGYSINLLDPGLADNDSFTALRMQLPPAEGFASNINLQHQAFPKGLKEYAELAESQSAKMQLRVLSARIENDAFVSEAVGKVGDLDIVLHFYFRAIKANRNIILATAVAPESRWLTDKKILVPIVNSLQAVEK